jgi:hypothetical protein
MSKNTFLVTLALGITFWNFPCGNITQAIVLDEDIRAVLLNSKGINFILSPEQVKEEKAGDVTETNPAIYKHKLIGTIANWSDLDPIQRILYPLWVLEMCLPNF